MYLNDVHRSLRLCDNDLDRIIFAVTLFYSNMQDHYLQSTKYNNKYLQNTLKVTGRCLQAFIRTD